MFRDDKIALHNGSHVINWRHAVPVNFRMYWRDAEFQVREKLWCKFIYSIHLFWFEYSTLNERDDVLLLILWINVIFISVFNI